MLALLCSVVRTKLVAFWIGPAGVGIITLYNSTMEMLYTTGQLNLRQSAVRDISAVAGRPAAAARVIAVLRRLMYFLGLAGMVLVAALSPLLSRWTFGERIPYLGFYCSFRHNVLHERIGRRIRRYAGA